MNTAEIFKDPELLSFREQLAAGIAGAVLLFAFYVSATYRGSDLVVLAASIFVAAILGRHEPFIPLTSVRLRPRDIVIYWGIIWMGLSGGVLIGLAATLFGTARGAPIKERIVLLTRDVVAVAISAMVVLLFLSSFRGILPEVSTGFILVPVELLAAVAVLGLVHFLTRAVLSRILNVQHSDDNGSKPLADRAISVVASYSVHVFSTVILFLVFNHFGIEFGLVVLPLVIMGHFAYSIHAKSLASKTKEILDASQLHLSTVEALATAIDARDQVGMGHVRRTQIYALGIGKAMGLGSDELNALRMGALLHDIGKLAVPDHILNKPGRLTPAEFEKTKIHALIGASILKSINFPYPVVPTVKFHHERWDGAGYPDGLRGSEIPITARILMVADVFDTLRGARPYRSPMKINEVIETLKNEAGKKFDPGVVDVFIENLEKFEKEVKAAGLGYEADNDSGAFTVTSFESDSGTNYIQHIKRANREVFTLYSLAKEFGATADIDDSLCLFTKKIKELAPYDTCVVYLLDKSSENAIARHVAGTDKDVLSLKSVAPGEGATGYVLKSRQVVQNVDPALDFAFSDAEFSRDYIGMASLPLIAGDQLVGAVSLYSRSVACYADEHIRLLETVSRIATDAIVRSQQLEEAETFALTDPMTGLPNSRGLQAQFEKEAKRADRNESGFQVLVLDLDGFKDINDTHGHKFGDTMLRAIGQVIKDQLREYDHIARYGGDEFVAIIPGTETIDVLELSRRIEKAVCSFEMRSEDGSVAKVGISIGAANYPTQGDNFDRVIEAADKAMYITKAIHRQERDPSVRVRTTLSERSFSMRPANVPPDPTEPETFTPLSDESRILELAEPSVISSAAIN